MRRPAHFLVSALACIGMAAPAVAQGPKIYAYESHANYCPAGLQPVTINGAICCGTPNQSQSYQQALRHPVKHKKTYSTHRSARAYLDCPAGVKGCD